MFLLLYPVNWENLGNILEYIHMLSSFFITENFFLHSYIL